MWEKKGRRWSLLRLQPLQIPGIFLWNIFPHVIFKPKCITLITELLMWPMRGAVFSFALEPQPSPSSALTDCFAAPAASRTVSPLVSSWTFPSKVYFAFLLVVPRRVAFHLLTLNPYADLSGACRLQQLPMPHLPCIAADVPGHIPSLSHISQASASSPGSVLHTMQLPRPSLPHSCCHSTATSVSVLFFQKIPLIYLVTTPAQ